MANFLSRNRDCAVESAKNLAKPKTRNSKLMSTPAVAVSGLSKYFPQLELRHLLTGRRAPGVWALKDVAFELFPGEGLCIVGPNGSGKTTLMKLIATLLTPTQGRISIQGRDAQAQPLRAKSHLGFITCNEASFYGRLSGWQNLAFFARLQNLDPKAAIPPVAESLRLEPYLDRRFFSCSSGIKRRFDIARGLLHRPDILLLDEPTTNLDPITAAEVRDLLAQLQAQGKTLITVTHNLEEVRKLGRRLAIMRAGNFLEVSLAPEENLEELYRRVVLGDGRAPQ
jgi:ABC-type multidrug transport system ATPase subunit